MSNPKSTTRIETTSDSTLITFTDYQSLSWVFRDTSLFERLAHHSQNLSDEESEILSSLYSTVDYETNTIRVASAKIYTETGVPILPNARNLLYCTSEISEREPTEDEKAVYEDSFSECPSPVYEFELPPLNKFEDPESNPEFESQIRESQLHSVGSTFQTQIEFAKWLKIKTSFIGNRDGLPIEWDPEKASRTKDEIRSAARQEYQSKRQSWEDMLNLSYLEWFAARLNQLNRTERKLDANEIVALEIVDESSNEDFCQYCGKITNQTNIFEIPTKIGKERRVCQYCAEEWSEFDSEQVQMALTE